MATKKYDITGWGQRMKNLCPAACYRLLYDAGENITPLWDSVSGIIDVPNTSLDLDIVLSQTNVEAKIAQVISDSGPSPEVLNRDDFVFRIADSEPPDALLGPAEGVFFVQSGNLGAKVKGPGGQTRRVLIGALV